MWKTEVENEMEKNLEYIFTYTKGSKVDQTLISNTEILKARAHIPR